MRKMGTPCCFCYSAFPDIPHEDRLLALAHQGNQKAIADIYEHYFDPIYQFIRWRVDDAGAAEDLTSEVFIKFLNALKSPNAPRETLRGWLFRVARNVLYDHYHQPDLDGQLDDPCRHRTIPKPSCSTGSMWSDSREALRALAVNQQEVLILRFSQMLSLEATAESMGRSVSAIKSLQFRAIQALRHVLMESTREAEHGLQ